MSEASTEARSPFERRLARWAACAALLPIPLWFAVAASLAPPPAWRAEYREHADFSGAGAIVAERELQRYWDRYNAGVPGGLGAKKFSARWDTCLTLDTAHDVPIMLVTDGSASFSIDGSERLSATSGVPRATRGEVLRLEAGTHHLQVALRPRGWASIALLASFDAAPPAPLGSGLLAPGVRSAPPVEGAEPCPPR